VDLVFVVAARTLQPDLSATADDFQLFPAFFAGYDLFGLLHLPIL